MESPSVSLRAVEDDDEDGEDSVCVRGVTNAWVVEEGTPPCVTNAEAGRSRGVQAIKVLFKAGMVALKWGSWILQIVRDTSTAPQCSAVWREGVEFNQQTNRSAVGESSTLLLCAALVAAASR